MITIKDVARKAGVSVTTVSRALNNYDDVNIDTKNHIIAVAKELNYVPNRAAQNLVKKENKTLALILSGLEKDGGKDNIVYRLLAGMFQYADEIQYEVILYTTDSAHQKEKSYVDFCKEHGISGAVLNGIKLDDPYLQEALDTGFPCVLIDIDVDAQNVSSVSINNEVAAYEAVQLLIDNNHKRIAMINGKKKADVSNKRFSGYKRALENHNIPYDPNLVIYADFVEEEAYVKTKELLEANPDITAIFCASDMMAFGTMHAIKDMGLKIPEDISVMGFDDIPLAAYFDPPLATVQQDFYLMGYYAARQLIRIIKNEPFEKKIFMEHKVLARDTISMI